MNDSAGWKAMRAVVIIGTLLAASSVVLWPLAVLALPLVFWAACGGRLARWTASLAGSLVVFIAAEVAVWLAVRASGGTLPLSSWSIAVVALAVVPASLVGFVRGSKWARERRDPGAPVEIRAVATAS